MQLTRREILKKLVIGGAAAAATGAVALPLSAQSEAEEQAVASPDAVCLLYDATRCVGCQSCVYACSQANNLQPNASVETLYLKTTELNVFTKNVIKMYRPAGSKDYSFIKQQCMHCLDPACVAGCPFRALDKDPRTGIVSWTPEKCVGCRYCEIACPYGTPKFQWTGFNPKIVKCEFCKERLAKGQEPACTAICPVNAVIFGKREVLLTTAKGRIAANPGKYFRNRVYGEFEGGGTQALYLTHVDPEKLGLPKLGPESIRQKYLKWQERLYSYLIFPVALYASVTANIRGTWKTHIEHLEEEEKKTGLRAQL